MLHLLKHMMKSNTSQKSYIGFAFQKVSIISINNKKSIRNEHVVQKFSMVVTRSETKGTNQKGYEKSCTTENFEAHSKLCTEFSCSKEKKNLQ